MEQGLFWFKPSSKKIEYFSENKVIYYCNWNYFFWSFMSLEILANEIINKSFWLYKFVNKINFF